jgi:hypothetical protein
VIVLTKPSHILISNKALLLSGKQTKIMVSDDFKVSLLFQNPLLKTSVKYLEDCLCGWEASCILAACLTIIIWLDPDIVNHMLGWR